MMASEIVKMTTGYHVEKYVKGKHLELLQTWWKYRGNPIPDPELMAPTGVVVSFEDEPVCAGFIFKTDAKIAVISHVVSTPDIIDKDARNKALDLLLDVLVVKARNDGFKMVSASSNVERLNRRYELHGFVKTDSNEVHYGRML